MQSVKVKDYMIYQPVTFTPETLLAQAVVRLLDSKQLGAPVVDVDLNLLGYISEQDCISFMLKGTYHCDMMTKVSECMRTDVLSADVNDSVLTLAETMTEPKPKVLPVVEDNRVIGIITRREILSALCQHLSAEEKNQL
jgi:CBS domain-containing protein